MNALAGRLRLAGLAALYGAVAGVLAQLTLQGMTSLQHLVWAGPAPWWRIAATICAGGALLIVLRRISEPLSMAELLRADPTDRARRHRIILVTAMSGIVSIAFGGAVGPEAGLLAVIALVSVLVGHFIIRDLREERMLHSASTAGALSGLYASPREPPPPTTASWDRRNCCRCWPAWQDSSPSCSAPRSFSAMTGLPRCSSLTVR